MAGALISFTIPMFNLWAAWKLCQPSSQEPFHTEPTSCFSNRVKRIIEEFLIFQNERHNKKSDTKEVYSPYKWARVFLKGGTASAVVNQRISVIDIEDENRLFFSTGRFEIGFIIGLQRDPIVQEGLEWAMISELAFTLPEYHITLSRVRVIISLVAAVFITLGLGWSALPALTAGIAIDLAVYSFLSQQLRQAADNEALSYFSLPKKPAQNPHLDPKACSPQQSNQKILKGGVKLLELMKAHKKTQNYWIRLKLWALFPSEDSRISKIHSVLKGFSNQRQKPA